MLWEFKGIFHPLFVVSRPPVGRAWSVCGAYLSVIPFAYRGGVLHIKVCFLLTSFLFFVITAHIWYVDLHFLPVPSCVQSFRIGSIVYVAPREGEIRWSRYFPLSQTLSPWGSVPHDSAHWRNLFLLCCALAKMFFYSLALLASFFFLDSLALLSFFSFWTRSLCLRVFLCLYWQGLGKQWIFEQGIAWAGFYGGGLGTLYE